MIVKIQGHSFTKNKFGGTVHAPASKSSMQRACAAALVRRSESIIRNPGRSNDDKAALKMIESLGASITELPEDSLRINSENFLGASTKFSNSVNCGESGLGIRM